MTGTPTCASTALRHLLAATPDPRGAESLSCNTLLDSFARMLDARAEILADVVLPVGVLSADDRAILAELERRNAAWQQLAERARDALPSPRAAAAQLRAYASHDVRSDDTAAQAAG
jgi:hypothetical protein